MTTTGTIAITPLTTAQRRVARHLIRGADNQYIAAHAHLSPGTVKNHISNIREKLNCPPRSTRAVLVHALLTHRQVPPPAVPCPDVGLGTEERNLLRAIADHSHADDIAEAAGIAPADLRARTAALIDKTGAEDSAHLVGIGHALAVLEAAGSNTLGPRDALEGAAR